MPIKRVYYWQPNAGSTVNSQLLNEFSQCAESFNAVRDGRWKPNLSLYRPLQREQLMPVDLPRDFLGISIPEQPSKYYLVIRSHRIVTEADSTIQILMEKLQSYKSRMSFTFEGIQYQMGDFLLRVGKVVPTHSENLRGIVMEVEYAPISSIDKGRAIMDDFFDIWHEALSKRSLPGHFSHIDANFSEFGLSDNYTAQHTAVQYACVMAQMISSAQSVQAARN